MLIRLGDVIYWIAAVCAVLWFEWESGSTT